MRRTRFVAVAVSLCAAGAGCMRPAPDPAGEPGAPLATLTEAELGRFLLGKAVFERLTTPEEGLGPLYNETRCSSCHDRPATGGSGGRLVTKASRYEAGACDLLVEHGGDNLQRRATALLIANGGGPETLPVEATATAEVTGPSLFGLGLVEAIPEAVLIEMEDPDDSDGDGVSGRAARTATGRLGRFGRKGEVATVLGFVDTALRFELGLTTPTNPLEETLNGVPVPAAADPMPDPEIDEGGMNILTDYVRFLAPPAREPALGAVRDSIERGEALFDRVGCTGCHVPTLRTGPSDVVALSGQEIHPYSDFLLHDMGPALADVCGLDAAPAEYRTARLWGLRYRDRLLHDGRAATPREAVLHHDGEAAAARNRFSLLSAEEQALLLRFLASL